MNYFIYRLVQYQVTLYKKNTHTTMKTKTIKIPVFIWYALKILQRKDQEERMLERQKPYHFFIRQWLTEYEEETCEIARKATQKKIIETNNDTK